MATRFTERIDIPLMLGRLRPGSEYHWKGNGFGTFADIGEWRDVNTICPTEDEIYAEWEAFLIEDEDRKQRERAITDDEIDNADTIEDLKALLKRMQKRGG